MGNYFLKFGYLANRLSPLLDKIVHSDQTGLIPGRNSFFNLRRLFNIIYSNNKPKEELAILSLNTEKVFDQVDWPYLFEILKRFNFGEKCISMVKLLYNNPCAQILTNEILSPRFNLYTGINLRFSISLDFCFSNRTHCWEYPLRPFNSWW